MQLKLMVRNLLLITSTTSLISFLLLIRMHYARVAKIAGILLSLGLMTVRIIIITCLSILGISISKYIFITHGMTSLILYPLIHIHFTQLTENRGWKRSDLVHGLPLLACIAYLPFAKVEYLRFEAFLFCLVLVFYWAMILQSLRKGIWSRPSQTAMVMKNFRQIRGISNVIFVTISIGLAYNICWLMVSPPSQVSPGINLMIVPSLLLLASSIKLLMDPGYHVRLRCRTEGGEKDQPSKRFTGYLVP